jgi:hypothetical protein
MDRKTYKSDVIPDALALQQLQKAILDASVEVERGRGRTWEMVGDALGITRSTAHGRFGHLRAARTNGNHAEMELLVLWHEVARLTREVLGEQANTDVRGPQT